MEDYLQTNAGQKREAEAAQKASQVATDPNQPQIARDEAIQRLDGLEGTTMPDDPVKGVANERPQDYDGGKAAKRVLEGSRHTDLNADS